LAQWLITKPAQRNTQHRHQKIHARTHARTQTTQHLKLISEQQAYCSYSSSSWRYKTWSN